MPDLDDKGKVACRHFAHAENPIALVNESLGRDAAITESNLHHIPEVGEEFYEFTKLTGNDQESLRLPDKFPRGALKGVTAFTRQLLQPFEKFRHFATAFREHTHRCVCHLESLPSIPAGALPCFIGLSCIKHNYTQYQPDTQIHPRGRSTLALSPEERLNHVMIEQAIYGGQDAGGYRFLAHSPGFRADWLAEAERLCSGFGDRPAAIACPWALFARPFARRHVAIVQVADQGQDDTGRPGALGFYLLVLPRSRYHELGGDPFFLAENFPPPWQARGELPSLTWSAASPPARSVALLQKTLNVPHSATLLGGVQILLDGGRLAFERSAPDAAILRSLWALLPTRERGELWPASFAFSNIHQFDAVVVPRAAGAEFEHYITEEKAGDYPEGRYECNLQSAIETGDQREIDALLNYSRSRMLRLIVLLVVVVMVLSLAMTRLLPGPTPVVPTTGMARSTAPVLDLPPVDRCPALSLRERKELAERLHRLGQDWHLEIPAGHSEEGLTAALNAVDKQLNPSTSRADPGPLRSFGPLQRQLRVLLWKKGVAAYNARGLNTVELIERLEEYLNRERKPMEKIRE